MCVDLKTKAGLRMSARKQTQDNGQDEEMTSEGVVSLYIQALFVFTIQGPGTDVGYER